MMRPEECTDSFVVFFLFYVIFSGLVKKMMHKTYPAPVTEPLTVSIVKAGDTLIIKGENPLVQWLLKIQ